MKEKRYYLGLDIGTNSVGYAVSDKQYNLRRYKGELAWGATLFEEVALAEERRGARTARRRLDRRQQRVALLEEIFASEIGKIDLNFFLRRRESTLFPEDSKAGVKLFDGGITDEDYHKSYPTIHHLIVELMENPEPHDVRLVYLACAWLVKHRGHFLFDAGDQVDDFGKICCKLEDYLRSECGCGLPWATDVCADTLREIMTAQVGVKRKQALFIERIYGGKKPPKKPDEAFPYSREAIVTLLCGGTAKLKDLFDKEEYAEIGSISLNMDEENFARILSEVGEDGELLQRLREIYDCALLTQTLNGCGYISEAKIKVYEQHKRDLAYLKSFVKKYTPEKYDLIFREEEKDNYVAYSGNVKSCKEPQKVKHIKKEPFSEFLLKNLKGLSVKEEDSDGYAEMMERLERRTFLPKQREPDNRVIPQQLYYVELERILENAGTYLPMLQEADGDGYSNADKIRSIFRFRIPYYVGPLNRAAKNSWVERKDGKIYPWNFEKMVDLDTSEEQVIPPRLSRRKAVRISRTAFLLPIGGREFREQHQLEVVERPVLA